MCPYYEWDSKKEEFVESPKPPKREKLQVLYRSAKNSDKQAMLNFEIECEKTEPEVFSYMSSFAERRRELESISFGKASDFRVLLALADNRIVGELSMSWYYDYDTNRKVGVIPGLWVLRPYRMAGIGRGLTDFAKREFKKLEVRRIELIVGLGNLAAQEFYKKLGFKTRKVGQSILDLE